VGKVFSFLGALQAMTPLVGKPLFGYLYKSTVQDFPYVFLFATAGLYLAEFALTLVAGCILKRGKRKARHINANTATISINYLE
jgi:hypothetical protein